MLTSGSVDDSEVPTGLAKVFGVVAIVVAVVFGVIAIRVWSGNPDGRMAAAGTAGFIGASGIAAMFDPSSLGVGIAVVILAAAIRTSSGRPELGVDRGSGELLGGGLPRLRVAQA